MTRFAGLVGYELGQVETEPDVWQAGGFVEKTLRGDLLSDTVRFNADDKSTNDDIELSQHVSVIADRFALANYMYIRYVVIDGVKWKVKSLTVVRPRIDIYVGGVWNE